MAFGAWRRGEVNGQPIQHEGAAAIVQLLRARQQGVVIRQGGCEAYISKPISVTSFLDTVRRFIG